MRTIIAPTPVEPVDTGVTPTFSVIIAAYQAAETVAAAVESALGQTSPPHEVIVCDDGSTDEIERALDPLRDRIVFLSQANGGEGSAKNAAAGAASGDFVAILDADDLYLPERLEALGELASARPDLDILTTDAYLEVDGRVVRHAYDESWTFEVADQRAAILQRNFIFGHAAVRRSALLERGRLRRVDSVDDRLGVLAAPHLRRLPGGPRGRAARPLPPARAGSFEPPGSDAARPGDDAREGHGHGGPPRPHPARAANPRRVPGRSASRGGRGGGPGAPVRRRPRRTPPLARDCDRARARCPHPAEGRRGRDRARARPAAHASPPAKELGRRGRGQGERRNAERPSGQRSGSGRI